MTMCKERVQKRNMGFKEHRRAATTDCENTGRSALVRLCQYDGQSVRSCVCNAILRCKPVGGYPASNCATTKRQIEPWGLLNDESELYMKSTK